MFDATQFLYRLVRIGGEGVKIHTGGAVKPGSENFNLDTIFNLGLWADPLFRPFSI